MIVHGMEMARFLRLMNEWEEILSIVIEDRAEIVVLSGFLGTGEYDFFIFIFCF